MVTHRGDIFMNEEKISKKDIICSILFCVWFFGSIIVGSYFGKHGKPMLLISIFGNIFFVLGLFLLYNAKNELRKNMMLFFVIYTGLAMIVSGILLQIQKYEFMVPLLFINLFTMFGVLFLIQTILKMNYEKAHMTYHIPNAICKDVKSRRRFVDREHGKNVSITYCPIYTIQYAGETIDVCNEEYTNFLNPDKEDICEIYINMDDPNEYMDKRTDFSNKLSLFIGIIFILCGLVITIMVFH